MFLRVLLREIAFPESGLRSSIQKNFQEFFGSFRGKFSPRKFLRLFWEIRRKLSEKS